MNVIKERWVAMDGCIYTERLVTKRSDITGNQLPPHRASIAFNVGQSVAERLVALHNNALTSK